MPHKTFLSGKIILSQSKNYKLKVSLWVYTKAYYCWNLHCRCENL